MKSSKYLSLLIVTAIYALAFLVCILAYNYLPFDHPVVKAALLDLLATVIIFAFSLIFNNSSVYDPYWSVAPVPIVIYWALNPLVENVNTARQWIVIALILFWGIRLTINWIRRWRGLIDEDWRYSDFRKTNPGLYWFISFAGFHLFPTVTVFLGCLAVYPALALYSDKLGILDIIAIVVTLSAVIIEMISDEQLKRFLRKNDDPKKFLTSGLWKYSRHPNYFGEVLFWVGLFIFSLSIEEFYWWTLAGPVSMILLFTFISIPMMDKRMQRRKPGFQDYKRSTSAFIPWFKQNV